MLISETDSVVALRPDPLTKAEVAKKYKVSVRTITNWMYRDKRITFTKIGRLPRFDPDRVQRELEAAGLVLATQP